MGLEHKQETLEEVAYNAWRNYEHVEGNLYPTTFKNGFKSGAKWQQDQDKNKYSDEEVVTILENFASTFDLITITQKEWFEQFKKQ